MCSFKTVSQICHHNQNTGLLLMIGFYDCEDSCVYLTGAYLEFFLIFMKEDLFEVYVYG